MRRIWILCVLFMLMTTAGAVAAQGISSSSTTHFARVDRATQHRHTMGDSRWRKSGRRTKAPKHKAVAHHPNGGKSSVLFGDTSVEVHADSNRAGRAGSFPFPNDTTGAARTIKVYVGSHNHAKTLIAGLYSNRNGRPGSLLGFGSLSRPSRGAWNTVRLTSRRFPTVDSGRTYWVAVLGKGGTLSFRAGSGKGCHSATSAQRSLAVLPRSWKTGRTSASRPISAYVSGTASSRGGATRPGQSLPVPTSPAPPSNPAPPTSPPSPVITSIPVTCDLNATPSNFGSQVAAATAWASNLFGDRQLRNVVGD